MKQGSTILLRAAVLIMGAVVLAVCIFAIPPALISDETGGYAPILLGLYAPAVPFFFALYQTMKLLSYIDKNTAFSKRSVIVLKKIQYAAVIITLLFMAGMPYIYYMAKKDDAPGVVALGLIIVFASFVIATFAAVLQKLLKNAIDIKSENDLTV